jgi:thiamine pyrophosphate-dependent acetolactate synthase large subunit-like protein
VRDLVPSVERAFSEARSGVPGPVFVECPVDLLYPEEVVREWYGLGGRKGGLAGWAQRIYLGRHVNRLFADADRSRPTPAMVEPVPAPEKELVLQIARKLKHARRPVLIAGSQAVCEPDRVAAVAESVDRLGVPTFLSGMARGLLGDRHSLHCRHQRRRALKEADLIILAGVPCDFRLDYGRRIGRGATLVSANRSRADLKLNCSPDIAVAADPGCLLVDLARAAPAAADAWADWRGTLAERDAARETEIDEQAATGGARVNPVALCRALNDALPRESIVVADGGDFVGTASYIVRPRAPLSWLDPGVFGTLGVGAGFALGAKLCRPESEVWALFGDGSLGYSIAEFDTFIRHGLPILAVVGNDACWSQIAREQVKLLGDDTAVMLERTDYHRVVGGFGAGGLLLDSDEDIGDVLSQARDVVAGGHAVLVNALLDRSDFREGSISI